MYDPTYRRMNVFVYSNRSRQRARWGAFLLTLGALALAMAAYWSMT